MRPKLAMLLSIIVVVPLATTAWLTYRMAEDEQEMLRHRVRELLEEPLREKDRKIVTFRETRERELLFLARKVDKVVTPWLDEPAQKALNANDNAPLNVDVPVQLNQQVFAQQRVMPAQQAVVPQQQAYAQQQTYAQQQVVPNRQRQMAPLVPNQSETFGRFTKKDKLPEYLRDELLSLSRRQPTIRQIFLVGSDGKLIHPNRDNPKSKSERDFLSRTERLWDEGQRFWAPSDSRASKKGGQLDSSPQNYGWHVWYWGQGMNLIFWLRRTSGAIIGVEMDRSHLLADVIGLLPDTSPTLPTLQGLVVLRDARGGKLYEWGSYKRQDKEKPKAAIHLSHPFNAWQLEYYQDHVDELLAGGLKGSLLMGLCGLGLALLWMAISFYREYTREIREAQQRVNFVNQVSHELKTPLTNIRMYAELLDDELLEEDEKANRYLGVIVSESQRLSRLIGNVLSFARHRRKKLKIRRSKGVIDEAVKGVIDRFRPSLKVKDLEVSFKGHAQEEVFFDGDALEQILGNLISNVEKYGAAGHFMEVVTELHAGSVTITVCDEGPGVSEDLHEQIFMPFFRASDELTEGAAGTGIGLAIARELARLHGGELCVKSAAKGACFQLTLNVSGGQ